MKEEGLLTPSRCTVEPPLPPTAAADGLGMMTPFFGLGVSGRMSCSLKFAVPIPRSSPSISTTAFIPTPIEEPTCLRGGRRCRCRCLGRRQAREGGPLERTSGKRSFFSREEVSDDADNDDKNLSTPFKTTSSTPPFFSHLEGIPPSSAPGRTASRTTLQSSRVTSPLPSNPSSTSTSASFVCLLLLLLLLLSGPLSPPLIFPLLTLLPLLLSSLALRSAYPVPNRQHTHTKKTPSRAAEMEAMITLGDTIIITLPSLFGPLLLKVSSPIFISISFPFQIKSASSGV